MELDPTSVSSARIYDYLLGGTYNTPADRKAGNQIEAKLPFIVQGMRINRWFLSFAAKQFLNQGLDCIIDAGAGLPTAGAIHEHLPDRTKILYVDADAETVRYGKHIIGERQNIQYIHARIEDIDQILAAAESLFGAERRVGICLVSVAHFIDDEAIAGVFRQLYNWSAPGSILALSSVKAFPDDPNWRQMVAMYEQGTGLRVSARDPEALAVLAQPWQPRDGGLLPFEHYAETELGTSIVEPPFRGKVGYAGFLQKR